MLPKPIRCLLQTLLTPSTLPNQDSETIKNSKGSINVSECKKICPATVIFSYAENGMVHTNFDGVVVKSVWQLHGNPGSNPS